MATQESRLDIVMELAAEGVESGLGGIGEMLGGLASPLGLATLGAGALGAGIAGIGAHALGLATDMDAAGDQMTAALSLTDEEAANLNQTMENIYANNFGESFDDIATSLIGVEQAFARVGDISEEEAQGITEDALAIRDVFGVDVAESANAAATLVEEFGLTTEEAMDFIATGFQNGLNASDDFLDTIGEYSTQFSESGATAEQFFGLLESGMQGGMLGTDKAADALKEFQVRILDGSTLTAASLEQIGIDSASFLEGLANGSMSTVEAFEIVNQKLGEVDDKSIQMQAGVGLIGTQFEDLGASAALALTTTGTSLAEMGNATESLNAKYTNLGAVGEGVWRRLELTIAPVGGVLLGLANDAMPAVEAGFIAVQPYIEAGAEWLGVNLPIAVNALTTAWNTQLYPALVLGGEYFNNNILPTLQAVWGFVDENLMPVIIDLGEIGFHGLRLAAIGLIGYWNESLYPSLQAVWVFVTEDLGPAWQWIGGIFSGIANTVAWLSDLLANMTTPPEWVLQMMGGSASTATAATTVTTIDDKGEGVAPKSMMRGMEGGLNIGNVTINGASSYQEAYMGAVNGIRDELRSRGVRVAA